MNLWHAWVGGGRFIIRAENKEQAIELAREEAVNYNESRQAAMKQDAGAELLDSEGEAKILDVDYS